MSNLCDDLVGPFLEALETLRNLCDGDLEKNVILLAIAVRAVAEPEFRALTLEERLSGSRQVLPSRGVNVRSIADSSGIPRETVRRKVAELIEDGWIAQSDRNLHFTPAGYQAVTPGREALERLAHQFHDIVAAWSRRRASA